MRELLAEIEIAAPADAVWRILTAFACFSEWNPFVVEAEGTSAVGGIVRVKVRTTMGVRLPFRATVLSCEPCRELRWFGYAGSPRLARGEHAFSIEPLGDRRVRFVQHEVFGGLLPPLLAPLLRVEVQRGFDSMNRALKARAEGARSACTGGSCGPLES